MCCLVVKFQFFARCEISSGAKPIHTLRSDVDECATSNGGCDSKRKCVNTQGSRKCEDCPSGWTNDGESQCVCGVTRYVENDACKACPPGHVCNGKTKTKCHETDQYIKDNNCVACLTGGTCDGNTVTCGTNKYIEDNQCKACPTPGYACNGQTKTKCDVTKEYVKDNKCVTCPTDYTCDGDKATRKLTKSL